MEFDPGHTAFSYPRRPCKLDRSFSWTGTTKSTYGDILGDTPSQYSLTDLDCDYGYHNQTEFFDVPSMFEDALRQLASTPCFAYQPVPLPTDSPRPIVHAMSSEAQPQHVAGPELDTLPPDTSNDELFLADYFSTGEIYQNSSFTSFPWFTTPSNSYTVSTTPPDSPAQLLDTMSSVLEQAQVDQPSNMSSPIPRQARISLETIDEEADRPIGILAYQGLSEGYIESSMSLQTYNNQSVSRNMAIPTIENHDYMYPQADDVELWQSLLPSADSDFSMLSPTKQEFQADDPSVVLAKVKFEVLKDGQGPITAPLPLNDLMSKFDSNPGVPLPKRRRRPFTEDAKTKVKRVRDIGACVFCRARKVPVSSLTSFPPSSLTFTSVLLKGRALHVSS